MEVPGGGAHLKIILKITTSQWYAKHSTVGIQITDLSGIQIINVIDSLSNEHYLLERERINTKVSETTRQRIDVSYSVVSAFQIMKYYLSSPNNNLVFGITL